MAANLEALQSRLPESEPLARFHGIARIVTRNPSARAEDGLGWIFRPLAKNWKSRHCPISGVSEDDFQDIIRQSLKASSMFGNPIPLTEAELRGVLKRAL